MGAVSGWIEGSSGPGDAETAGVLDTRTVGPQENEDSSDEDSFHSFESEAERDKFHLVSGQQILVTLADYLEKTIG
jgi:hypothetical protein